MEALERLYQFWTQGPADQSMPSSFDPDDIFHQTEPFTKFGLDPFKDAISIPGLAYQAMLKKLPPFTILSLFGPKYASLHDELRQNLIAGPAIIFRRYAKCDDPIFPLPDGRLVDTIHGFDANSL